MFSFNKTVLCIEFSKTSVFCALAQVAGRKVDILAIDSLQLEGDIIEEGVIYDVPHLQQVIKNLITTVSKDHSNIDAAWLVLPNNKVVISKFEVEKDKKGISEDNIHKAVEEKFNHSASKLYLINKPILEVNKKVFFLSNGMRTDHLEPFIEVFKPLNITVEAVFPSFQCIFEELKEHFAAPSLLLYPSKKGYKFFLADENGVYLESVWGHNVIEFNENFDKAVQEVIQYAKQSREVAMTIKKILVIESNLFENDEIAFYLSKLGIEWSFIPHNASEDGIDPVSLVVLKGLIKAAMSKENPKGFLGPQITHLSADQIAFAQAMSRPPKIDASSDISPTPAVNSTYVPEEGNRRKWNIKSILGYAILVVALLALMFYLGAKIAGRTTESDTTQQTTSTPTPQPTSSGSSPTPTSVRATPTPTPTPTQTALTKQQVTALVLNGNNISGEAAKINSILKNNGFNTKTPGNNPVKNVATTTVTYKNPAAQSLAEEIVKLIEPNYPSAKAVIDTNGTEDILVVLGNK